MYISIIQIMKSTYFDACARLEISELCQESFLCLFIIPIIAFDHVQEESNRFAISEREPHKYATIHGLAIVVSPVSEEQKQD